MNTTIRTNNMQYSDAVAVINAAIAASFMASGSHYNGSLLVKVDGVELEPRSSRSWSISVQHGVDSSESEAEGPAPTVSAFATAEVLDDGHNGCGSSPMHATLTRYTRVSATKVAAIIVAAEGWPEEDQPFGAFGLEAALSSVAFRPTMTRDPRGGLTVHGDNAAAMFIGDYIAMWEDCGCTDRASHNANCDAAPEHHEWAREDYSSLKRLLSEGISGDAGPVRVVVEGDTLVVEGLVGTRVVLPWALAAEVAEAMEASAS